MPLGSSFTNMFDMGLRARNAGRARAAPRGLLLVRSGGLGDIALFAQAAGWFTALAEPGERTALLTRDTNLGMTFLLPPDIEVITYDFGRFRSDLKYRAEVTRGLYSRSFRRVVSTDYLRYPLVDEAIMLACAAPLTEAMAGRTRPKSKPRLDANAKRMTRVIDTGGGAPMLRRWADLAFALSDRAGPAPLTLTRPANLAPPEASARPAAVLHPYASIGEKQPAPELCLKIIEHLDAALGPDADIVITGGPQDRARNPEYEILFSRPNVRFDGRKFKDVVPLLRAARIVVSADTGLMHLAAAAGAPTVALCAAAFVGDITPYPKEASPPNARFIYTPMPCEGCLGACALPREEGRWPCVARLDADEAIAEIRALMSETEAETKTKTGDTP